MRPLPFTVKICGVKSTNDVDAVAAAGADAVGLNFFSRSIRYLEPSQRREIVDHARNAGMNPVGVFVNASAAEILSVCAELGLQTVQLHGDEDLQVAETVLKSGLSVVRAIRLPRGQLSSDQIDTAAYAWIGAGCSVLFDADAGSAFGGEGLQLDWCSLGTWRSERNRQLSFGLAGGLSPETVFTAIRTSGATAVDVASGVEEPRGTKSSDLIQSFVGQARRGLVLPKK
jgi:phosphoribosylanthranilate isomerase